MKAKNIVHIVAILLILATCISFAFSTYQEWKSIKDPIEAAFFGIVYIFLFIILILELSVWRSAVYLLSPEKRTKAGAVWHILSILLALLDVVVMANVFSVDIKLQESVMLGIPAYLILFHLIDLVRLELKSE